MLNVSVRTPGELRAARSALGLSAEDLARMVGVEDGRTVRRWEAGERELPGGVTVMVETALSYVNKIEMISHQLDEMKSGKMRVGDGRSDQTADAITRLTQAKNDYEEAFEMLTRRPAPTRNATVNIHWYHLRRMTPKFGAGKDDWSLPGERSPEAALAYFEKHEGFKEGLELCNDDDLSADFILEQKILHSQRRGAASWLTPGELVRTFFVTRKTAIKPNA